MTTGDGVLPKQHIRQLIQNGFITHAKEEHINPASLDLEISDEIYRINKVFLPKAGESIRGILPDVGAMPHNLAYPLERKVAYIGRLTAELKLPEHVYSFCNPKSSTGRNDLLARVVADGIPRYDSISQRGYHGNLWTIIQPQSFPVRLPPGVALSQMRFFTRDTRLNETALQLVFDSKGLLWDTDKKPLSYDAVVKGGDRDGSLVLTAHVPEGLAGWECLETTRVLDFGKMNYYKPGDFFRPIYSCKGEIDLVPGRFYILYSREYLRIPPELSCEVVPMDERSGEFRSHYAGYFDPGWGWKNGNGTGRRMVFEVRPMSDIITFRDGQAIAKIRLEYMAETPESNYDSESTNSHYQRQGEISAPTLSKHFDMSGYAGNEMIPPQIDSQGQDDTIGLTLRSLPNRKETL